MLLVEHVSVAFGGIQALDDVGLEVPAASVTGLIGPNGAGKTTLFNVITGLQRPTRGRVVLGDMDVTGLGAKRRARLGLGRTFQRLELFGSLNGRDNILVALEGQSRARLSSRAKGERADELLARVGLNGEADTPASVLPTGSARLLELARALACEPKVLLLDEPSSGLDETESGHLGNLLLELAAEGIAVLLVEHHMELVMRICAQITVLDFGRTLAAGSPGEIQTDSQVQAAYLGTAS